MCVAGGRRCPGSHCPSAKQRARRKANNAYRAAVAQAIEDKTGNAELARKVKSASMTDVADVVTAAGLNGEAIAKQMWHGLLHGCRWSDHHCGRGTGWNCASHTNY